MKLPCPSLYHHLFYPASLLSLSLLSFEPCGLGQWYLLGQLTYNQYLRPPRFKLAFRRREIPRRWSCTFDEACLGEGRHCPVGIGLLDLLHEDACIPASTKSQHPTAKRRGGFKQTPPFFCRIVLAEQRPPPPAHRSVHEAKGCRRSPFHGGVKIETEGMHAYTSRRKSFDLKSRGRTCSGERHIGLYACACVCRRTR